MLNLFIQPKNWKLTFSIVLAFVAVGCTDASTMESNGVVEESKSSPSSSHADVDKMAATETPVANPDGIGTVPDEETTPATLPKESSHHARAALRKLGAKFHNQADGLMVDFDLIRGEFPNDQLGHVQHLQNVGSVRLPEGTMNAGLAEISAASTLTTLAITGNNISDVGLKHLHTMTNLRRIVLWSNRVTESGLSELRVALPDCKIEKQ